jgi:hypothetical protein
VSGDLKVTIEELSFFGQGLHDFVIEEGGFSGWDDGVDMRVEDTARPQRHGSLDLPVYQGSRTVSLSGQSYADVNAKLRWNRNRLTGLLAGGGSGRIQVDRDGDVQWADCKLAARTKFTERGGRNIADYQVQVWCPDGRKYGRAWEFVATVGNNAAGVRHYGNFEATPKFVVTGNDPVGYTLTIKGQPFNVVYPLTPGQPHTIDYDDGDLLINGVIIPGAIGYGFTPKVTPGAPTALAIETAGGGTATATLTLFDTFI